jgi:tryptophan-rich sensory protein
VPRLSAFCQVVLAAKWSIFLLLLATANAVIFGAVSSTAGLLLVPYVIWVMYMTSLNIEIAKLNMHNAPPSHKSAQGDI